uniref:THAP domain-containing protein 1 n=1 Tax=Paramormyrops kingsleyae TaxID=1676925 RepID=A0A3B3R6J3_9TELE
MQSYNFTVVHRSGVQHANVDALSRRPCAAVGCNYYDRRDAQEMDVLSFFTFPSDIRRKWIIAIQRDKFAVTPHTRVSSRHFKAEDIRETASERGRRLLKKGAVPALFWLELRIRDCRSACN